MAKTVQVRPGETIPVDLGIHGSRAQQLEFLIRTQPKKGKVSGVQITGINSAVVKYTAGREAGEDRFTYAVRNADGVSAPAAVTITIVAAPALPARLASVDELAFPEVIVGRDSTALLEITNQGGSPAEGELTVPEGWSVEGTTRYMLAPGKREVFKLVFAPAKAGEFAGNAVFGPKPQRAVTLRGVAKAPIDFSPTSLDLIAPPKSQTREAVLRVTNRGAEPRNVAVTASPRLLVEPTVTVPPGGTVDLRVFAAADQAGAIDETMKLESGAWKADVPVRARPIPAMVRFSTQVPDFGKVVAGVPAEAAVELENSGGLPVTVAMRVEAPFEVSAAGVQVPAKGTARVPVRLLAKAPGVVSATLVADSGTDSERLPLQVEAAPASDSPPPPRAPSEKPTAPEVPVSVPKAEIEAAPSLESLPPPNMAEVPGKMGKYVRDITAASALVEWPASVGPGEALAVDERLVTKGPDGMPVVQWRAIPSTQISEAAGLRRATLQKLRPGSLYVIRVTSKGQPVFATKFITLPDKPWLDISWRGVLLIALLAILGAVGWRRWKTRAKAAW